MDNDNKKPPDDEQEDQHAANIPRTVLHLSDNQVGETQTETDQPLTRRVSFEMPRGTGWQSTLEFQTLDEAKALVKEMLDSILPSSEPDKETSTSTLTTVTASTHSYDDERLHRILRLLDRYTRNLAAIEEQILNANREPQTSQTRERVAPTLAIKAKPNELATQTRSSNTLRLDVTSSRIPQPQQQQDLDVVPPCERRHHIITISANSSAPFVRRPPQHTIMGRIGQTMGDFAGAFCMCLQVNKDCIFCLGFFLALVISASFLTAFFYRTINLSSTPIRVPVDSVRATAVPSGGESATLRFNGGYYYIYNNHRQHYVP